MARPRKGAAVTAGAPAAHPPLQGVGVTFVGRFIDGHTQVTLETIVKTLGGTVWKTLAKATTHLVASESEAEISVKASQARAQNIPIVSQTWLVETEKHNRLADVDKHTWDAIKQAAKDAEGDNGNGDDSKKRTKSAGGDNGDDDKDVQPQSKKARTTNGTAKPTNNGTKANGQTNGKNNTPKDKIVAEGQFAKQKDVVIPIDECCPLTTYQVYIDPKSGMIYDASLNQSNATNNANKFYRLQVLVETKTSTYKTWTRWGRVGEAGQNAILGDGTLEKAIDAFEKKFRGKSGLAWKNREDDPQNGKYAFVERSYNPDDSEEEEDEVATKEEDEDDDFEPPESKLEPPIKELMELIFNQKYFQATMSDLNYDANKLPLGKLSKATITRGFRQLKELAALFDDPSIAQSKWGTTSGAAIENLSNTYYSVIPHAFGRNRPPVISNDRTLKREVDLLQSLSDMKDAADIMKLERKTTKDSLHTLDRQFQGLGLEQMVALDSTSNEYQMLGKYLHDSRGSTHHFQYNIKEIFRIERQGENKRFQDSEFAKIPSDRRLLWHGSRTTNFGGILSQGLRIAPPEAPVSGYMFGRGIYLADISSKSAGYCCSNISGGEALLLLCEAELGSPMQELTNANYNAGEDAKANGQWSTLGLGEVGPQKWIDAGAAHNDLQGVKMPDTTAQPAPTNVNGASLFYNEYICYDVAQVRLRYLFRVKM